MEVGAREIKKREVDDKNEEEEEGFFSPCRYGLFLTPAGASLTLIFFRRLHYGFRLPENYPPLFLRGKFVKKSRCDGTRDSISSWYFRLASVDVEVKFF